MSKTSAKNTTISKNTFLGIPLDFLRSPRLYLSEIRYVQDFVDTKWYVDNYNIDQQKYPSAALHYVTLGANLGYDPSPDFSTHLYLQNNPDVKQSNMSALHHYVLHGRHEGRFVRGAVDLIKGLQDQIADAYAQDQNKVHEPWLTLIVPTYNTPARYLDALWHSVKDQRASGLHIIFSDDGSPDEASRKHLSLLADQEGVDVILSKDNGGISNASNRALEKVTTPWVSFLDHDDFLGDNAVWVLKQAIDAYPETKFWFTDEAIVDDDGVPSGAFLKPAFDPILLSCINYINHLSLYKSERVKALGGLRPAFDGSQDYDLVLRYTKDLSDREIRHIPFPAYHWRRTDETYSQRFAEKSARAARASLTEHFANTPNFQKITPSQDGEGHWVHFETSKTNAPLVSIIIPNKNSPKLLATVLTGVFEKTNYPNLEVIIVDNGSTDKKTLELYDAYRKKHANFQVEIQPAPFNFAAMINRGFSLAKGDHYFLLNNDIEIITPNWLDEMVACLNFEHVEIVGAKLLYANDTIQHAGITVGAQNLAVHTYAHSSRKFGGPMNRLFFRNTMTAVTGAAMLISGRCLEEVGLWDEENFAIAYNDVDFCMRARKAGFRCAITPQALLYHHESISRGSDETPQNRARFKREQERLIQIHGTDHFTDPSTTPFFENRKDRFEQFYASALNLGRCWNS